MAPHPVSPYHQMPTPFSPQIPMTAQVEAHAINLQPRKPGVGTGKASMSPVTAWRLDKTIASRNPKPKRPYTPYNLFYLLERELVVQKLNGPSSSTKRKHTGTIPPREEDRIKFPSRYDGVVMAPYWYDPNMKQKRKHRKTHGMISFKELTGIISANWASVDKETKEYVTAISDLGRKRYKDEMTSFNASRKIIQLKEEHADITAVTAKTLKKQATMKNVHSGSPKRRNAGSLKGKPFPITPDQTISNLPIAHKPSAAHKPSTEHKSSFPVVTPPRRFNHPNAPYHQFQLPPSLPPPMPATMLCPPNMPPSYHNRPRQFECPLNTTKKDSILKVGNDAIVDSSGDLSHDALLDHEFMNFEPDHVTEDVALEESDKAASINTVPKTVEHEDILDMIKGDMWNIDNLNFDEDPFTFLAD